MKDISGKIILIIIAGCMFVFLYWGLDMSGEKAKKGCIESRENFKDLTNFINKEGEEVELKGILQKKYKYSNRFCNTFHFCMDDSNMNFRAIGSSRNFSYELNSFVFFVQIGDSLYKAAGSDSLFVYRKNKEYYFVVGKIINQ